MLAHVIAAAAFIFPHLAVDVSFLNSLSRFYPGLLSSYSTTDLCLK
jgi:hypothetical protein